MSSPQIERVEEDVEEEDSTEQPQTTQPVQDKPSKKPVKNVDGSADEHVENAQSKPIYACKTVKKLSKDERSMLEDKFEKGVEDPYFKVIRMSNGAIRITKRRNPIVQNVEEAQQQRSTRIANKVNHLTNEQLLMEHIIDLETRFESMRLKHKKLKKRYNELENSIYEDVDEHSTPVIPSESLQEIPEKIEKSDKSDTSLPPCTDDAQQPEQQVFTAKRRLKKSSWRDSVQYM